MNSEVVYMYECETIIFHTAYSLGIFAIYALYHLNSWENRIRIIFQSLTVIITQITENYKVAFGTGESTLLLASRFLGMWFLTIWMPRNVAIPMFDFIGNILRFLGMWDDNIWFIPRNLKWIIYFSHSILKFECKLPSPSKKNLPVNK